MTLNRLRAALIALVLLSAWPAAAQLFTFSVTGDCTGNDGGTGTAALTCPASSDFDRFGAACDGTTDDAAAYAAASAWLSGANNREVRLPAGKVCATSATVSLGDGRQRSTTLSSGASGGAASLAVASCTDTSSGDGVVVQLDSGTYKGTANGACSAGSLPITPVLTGAAASDNAVYTGQNSTYNGGGYRGYGSCQTAAEISGGAAISTIKYIGAAAPTTTLTVAGEIGATSLTVASIAGFGGNGLGVPVGVTLNNGRMWWTWVPETPAGFTVKIANELPSEASIDNVVVIANNPVVQINGPILGPILEGVCLDANNLAAVGLDARQPMGGKFQGPRGVTAINYTGIGHFIHSARSLAKHATGTVDNDFELHAQLPQNEMTIGAWLAGTPDLQANTHLFVGFSRNRFHGGRLTMGGNDPTAAGLRMEFLDNNTFFKPYTVTNGAGLGAGLYRQPSYQRDFFPHENVHIAPAYVGGVVNGTAGGNFTKLKNDVFIGYSVSDGEAIPPDAAVGTTADAIPFGWKTRITPKTANYTLLEGDSSSSFTNSGASGQVDFILPTKENGLTYCFKVVAAQPLRIVAGGSDRIDLGTVNSAVGGYIESSIASSAVCLTGTPGVVRWVASDVMGAWSIDGATAMQGVTLAGTETLTNKTLTDAIDDGFKVSTADHVKTSDTTLTAVAGLSIALTAGKTYSCRGHLTVTAVDAAGGVKVQVGTSNGLTATTSSFTATTWNGAVPSPKETSTAFPAAIGEATAVATDVDIVGAIVVNSPGNVVIKAAQNASNPAPTTFGQNSTFSCKRVD